ncbi:CCA tRNA nucleotidyltransferase [Naumannella halotolerans]|uniref:Poly(A) polymerase n=1 Tax=Naumannella halotolerans TaxID=993414 RepID=A0A4V3EMV3_9ACTN|nr:CCA tRNA nucleotidyltransferase [Naumannella halotolerans]TDT30978.1 poly(A) polymerase [Naumannella halotolerans]
MPDLSEVQANAVAELLRIAPVVERLGVRFADAGYELHLVGGSVRDALLGRLGHDLDFTTDARPDEIERLLSSYTSGIKGAAVWAIGKEFGTIGARIPTEGPRDVGESPDWVVEITTYRADIYRPESRKPEVAFGDTLQGDLVRRDFTVNAMAIKVGENTFTDPYGGLADLAQSVLRTPGTPEQSFSDDPLRMMRAARFAAQLQMQPAPEVLSAMTAMADRIQIISAERVRDELSKLLLADKPRAGLAMLVATGIADHVLPELPAMRLEVDEHHRHKDVFEHSLVVLDQAIDLEKRRGHAPDLINRLAALLHDVGKPATRRFVDDGKVTFHHHDVVGAKLVKKRLKALRFSSDEIAAVAKLVELHLRFHGYGDGQWTDSAVRRYVRDAGDQLERLHILTRADCTTRNKRKAERLRRAYDDLEDRIDALAAEEELGAMRPDLNGDQIMAILGIGPGKEVGQAYKFLLEQRIDNGPLGEEAAKQVLLEWWQSRD